MGVSKEEEKKKVIEILFKEIIAENHYNLENEPVILI